MQLERIQEMAPPKGVAVMTISSLLDGLKTPGGIMMVAAAATHTASRQSALPLLALNAEMQKYNQQMQQNNNANGRAAAASAAAAAAAAAAASRGSIPTMVLETPPSSASPTTPTIVYEERAINTELSGDDFREQLLRRTADGHIICSRCLDASKEHYYCCPPLRNACEELGSPQQEGSLSFANIKLDCMCSQSEDLDLDQMQLAQQQHQQQQLRRPVVRTAATNTPPTSCKRGPRNLLEAEVSISYQICDNCRNKYRLSDKPLRRRSGSCTQAEPHPAPPTQTRSSELLDRTEDNTVTVVVGTKTARSTDDIALYKTTHPGDSDSEPIAAQLSLGNVSNTSNNSTSQTDKTSGSGAGGQRAKRPDKLVLDLNDRSKYTKEVSV
ncbi:GH21231 [Drosophila grimshawi]|nr:GH21231 [Drosophila grimshawi]